MTKSKHSVRMNPECKEKALERMRSNPQYITQEELSRKVQLARATVSKFFNSKPISIENFRALCKALQLNEKEIITTYKFDWGDSPDAHELPYYKEEGQHLEELITQDNGPRVISLQGLPSIRKTFLTKQVSCNQSDKFNFIYWRNLKEIKTPEEFLTNILFFFEEGKNEELDFKNKLDLFISFIKANNCLIILNHLESVMKTGSRLGEFRDEYRNYVDIIRLVSEKDHLSRLILVSSETPKYILTHINSNLPIQEVRITGYSYKEISKSFTELQKNNCDEERNLITKYGGHPTFIRIARGYIENAFHGNIRSFLDSGPIVINGIKERLDSIFSRISHDEHIVINWISLNPEAVTEEYLRENIDASIERRLRDLILSLRKRSLLEIQDNSEYRLFYYIREYLLILLIENIVNEIQTSDIRTLNDYPLVQVNMKDAIQIRQQEMVVKPIFHKLEKIYVNSRDLVSRLEEIIKILRNNLSHSSRYAVGNILTILEMALKHDKTLNRVVIKDTNFSGLHIRNADFRSLQLRNVDFSHTDLSHSIFRQSFGGILSTELSHDGKFLAIGDTLNRVHVWSFRKNQFVFHKTYIGHTNWVRAVAISPDNQYLVSGGEDHQLIVWDLDTGEIRGICRGYRNRIRSLVFSPCGNYLASASEDSTVMLWNSNSWQLEGTYTGGSQHQRFRAVLFDKIGQNLIAANQNGDILIWDIQNDKELQNPKIIRFVEGIRTISLHPDGEILAVGHNDGCIRLLDINTSNLIDTLDAHTTWIRKVIFSPNGEFLTSSDEKGIIKIWDIRIRNCIRELNEHRGRVWGLAFCPNSHQLISGSDDQNIKLWDIRTGKCQRTLHGHTYKLRSVAFSPDGHYLVSGGDDQTICFWKIDKNQSTLINEFQGHQGRIWSLSYVGKYIVSASDDWTVKYWDTTRCSDSSCVHTLTHHTSWVRSAALSPDQTLIASGGDDKVIRIYDLRTHKTQEFDHVHQDWIISVKFSPDGKYIVSSGDDWTVRIWDVQTGHCIYTSTQHKSAVRSVAVSPNGKWVASGSRDKTVRVFELLEPHNYLEPLIEHDDWVQCVAFHPNSRILASGSYDHTIILWDIEQGTPVRILRKHEAAVISISFSPDGSMLATCGEDGRIILWNVETGRVIQRIQPCRPYEGLNITEAWGLTRAQRATLIDLGAVDKTKERQRF